MVLDIATALLDDPHAQLDRDASEDVAAAWARLETLPRPEGQHPYLAFLGSDAVGLDRRFIAGAGFGHLPATGYRFVEVRELP